MNARDVLHYGHLTVHGTLETVPLAEWERSGVCGIWSVKNIVAHLASYERLLEEILSSFTDRQPTPVLDSYLAIGPESFNDLEVDKRRALDPDATRADYDAAHHAVMALLTRLSPEQLSQPGTLPWYGAEYALDDFVVYQYYGHKREHMAQVAALADQLR